MCSHVVHTLLLAETMLALSSLLLAETMLALSSATTAASALDPSRLSPSFDDVLSPFLLLSKAWTWQGHVGGTATTTAATTLLQQQQHQHHCYSSNSSSNSSSKGVGQRGEVSCGIYCTWCGIDKTRSGPGAGIDYIPTRIFFF